MTIGERLKSERERLGLSQTAMGQAGGVGRTTVIAWEQGTAFPNAQFLYEMATMGADIRWIVTGVRDYEPPPPLTTEEQAMLGYFRDASAEVRRAALGALVGAAPARNVFNGPVGQHVVGGNHSGYTVNMPGSMSVTAHPSKGRRKKP